MRLYLYVFGLLVFLNACSSNKPSEKKENKAQTLSESTSDSELQKLENLPKFNRIVCIGENVTEVVMALGDSAKIIAIDRNNPAYPNLKRPKVGFKGTLKSRFVLEQKPDLVLSDWDGSPDEVVEEVQAKGINYFRLKKELDLNSTKKFIRQIAIILKKKKRAERLIEEMDKNYAEITKILNNRKDSMRVLYVHARGPQVLLAAGTGTSADELIRLAGGKNVASEFEGMERLNPEDFLTLNPTFIIMSRKGFSTIESRLYEVPELVGTFAYRAGQVIFFDDYQVMNPGINASKIALEITKKLYLQRVYQPLPAMILPDSAKSQIKVETKKKEDIEIIPEEGN